MHFKLNKDSEFPIYQQLKEQIKYFLLSGVLQPGTRVPTPKDLGEYLRINKNTVITAYKELENEGLLMTKRGQGTYVSDIISVSADNERRSALMSLVSETIEKTKQLGFGAEDLFTLVFNQVVLGQEAAEQGKIRALIVECNMPDLKYLQETLERELKIQMDGCLLSELQYRIDEGIAKEADFVITTITHVEDVKAILEPLGKEVTAIYAAPHIQTFMRIAQLPQGTRVGLFCGTEKGACSMKDALEKAGISNISIQYCGVDDDKRLNQLIYQVDWVVTSRMAYDKLKSVAPPNVKFMQFFAELDEAGIEMLKQYLKKRDFLK
jgi:DNA-binding transcriptional regulator YhcF (GntR family)